ncbi:ESPR-type extended signal peptide-containing protein, partial [Acinetobacter sp. YH12131]|uniref:ESPR-type extended signal peptide-containing protein n=1 Tax=Acinetobacter sp. YH12131 TaxID=2601115 RepID=UPI00211EADAB
MNKIYKVIWNATLGTWVAVSEIAKGKTKSSKVTKIMAAATVSLMVSFSPEAFAAWSAGNATGVGQDSFGLNTDATSIAVGTSTGVSKTTGAYALAIGNSATANGINSIAFGNGANANNNTGNVAKSSLAIGYQAKANGEGVTAIGSKANATGTDSVAIGTSANATNPNTVAIGTSANAASVNSVAIGNAASSTAGNTVAIGGNTEATRNSAIAMGGSTFTGANNIYGKTSARGMGAIALGVGAVASNTNNIAIGTGSSSLGRNSIAMGTSNNGITAFNPANTTTRQQIGNSYVTVNPVVPAYPNNVSMIAANGSQTSTANFLYDGVGTDVTNIVSATYTNGSVTTNLTGVQAQNLYNAVTGGNLITSLATPGAVQGIGTHRIEIVTPFDDSSNSLTMNVDQQNKVSNPNNNAKVVINRDASGAITGGFLNGIAMDAGKAQQLYTALYTGNAISTGGNSIALGQSAWATGNDTIAIGSAAKAMTTNSIAIGLNSAVYGPMGSGNVFGISMGVGAVSGIAPGTLNADDSTAIFSTNGVAIGSGADATATAQASPVAIGWFAKATGAGSQVAIGDWAVATGKNAVGIGGNPGSAGTLAKGDYSLAIGPSTQALNKNTIAMGKAAKASDDDAVAIGGNDTAGAQASAAGAVAIGGNTKASAAGSMALAQNSIASATGAVAIGGGSVADIANSVAVGTGSKVAAYQQASGLVNGRNLTFAGGGAGLNVLSVGVKNAERQIQNVAAGRIAADSTDAVNGSQLYQTFDMSVKYDADPNNPTKVDHNNVTFAGTKATPAVVDPATGKMDMKGGTSLHNVASAGDYTDVNNAYNAVNAGDLNNAVTDVTNKGIKFGDGTTENNFALGETIRVTGDSNITTETTTNGVQVKLNPALNVTSVTAGDSKLDTNGLSITGGPSITKVGIDAAGSKITNVGNATTASDAVNKGQLDSSLANANSNAAVVYTDAAGNKVTKAADGKWYAATVVNADGSLIGSPSEVAAANIITSVQNASGSTTTATKLGNVAAGSVTASSTDAINGSQLYNTANNVKNLIGGTTTIDANTGVITTSNIGGTGKNTIDEAISSVKGAAETPMTFVGNARKSGDTKDVERKLGESLKISGAATTAGSYSGKNVRTVTDQTGSIAIELAENLDVTSVKAGDSTLNTNGLSITGGPSITKTGGINAGGSKITNVGNATTASDAVNKGQLDSSLANANSNAAVVYTDAAGNKVTKAA